MQCHTGTYPSTIEEGRDILRDRDRQLRANNSWDFYYGSNFAFMKEVVYYKTNIIL